MPIDSGHTAWILTATALVLFMTLPGLALFYAGLVRVKLFENPRLKSRRDAWRHRLHPDHP